MPDKYSNAQFADGRLRLHGSYEIRKEAELFVIEVEGPFNLESVLALGQARQAAMAEWCTDQGQGQGQAQAWMVIFNTSMMMSLEALEAYSSGLQQQLQASSPVIALAWVVGPEVEGGLIMLDHFARIFSQYALPWQVFEDSYSAKIWLQASLNASRTN